MNQHRTTVFTFALVVLMAFAASCSSSSDGLDPDTKEIPITEGEVSEGTQDELAHKSKHLFESGMYDLSRQNFDALRNTYPEGPYVEFAEIKIADSHFADGSYGEAALLYEDFIKNHPSSPAMPYMLLRTGRSFQLKSKGVGRDMTPIRKSVEYYRRLAAEYPDSPYYYAARAYQDAAEHTLAESEEIVMAYYKKRGHEAAYEARKEEFDVEYAAVMASPMKEPQPQILNPSLVEGGSAPREPVVLAASTVSASTLQAPSAKPKKVVRAEPARIIRRPSLPAGTRIQQVKCTASGGEQIYVYLTAPIEDQNFLRANKTLVPSDSGITLALPARPVRKLTIDCFGNDDLLISEEGELSLNTDKSYSLVQLHHPTRLMLLAN